MRTKACEGSAANPLTGPRALALNLEEKGSPMRRQVLFIAAAALVTLGGAARAQTALP